MSSLRLATPDERVKHDAAKPMQETTRTRTETEMLLRKSWSPRAYHARSSFTLHSSRVDAKGRQHTGDRLTRRR